MLLFVFVLLVVEELERDVRLNCWRRGSSFKRYANAVDAVVWLDSALWLMVVLVFFVSIFYCHYLIDIGHCSFLVLLKKFMKKNIT